MPRVLIVEHDPAARGRLRQGLEGTCEVLETGDVRFALALALHDKPDAILLDLALPDWAGYELCQALASLSFTRLIPIFIMTDESADRLKAFCQNLCAVDYFEKPVDLDALRDRLEAVLANPRPERRAEVRVWLRLILRLRGKDTAGTKFDLLTTTEDVSANGFLCRCTASVPKGAIVDVSLMNGGEHPVGRAQAVRGEWESQLIPHYGFRFTHTPLVWVLQ
jgi:DNA-binding response OmpR family regulator